MLCFNLSDSSIAVAKDLVLDNDVNQYGGLAPDDLLKGEFNGVVYEEREDEAEGA